MLRIAGEMGLRSLRYAVELGDSGELFRVQAGSSYAAIITPMFVATYGQNN